MPQQTDNAPWDDWQEADFEEVAGYLNDMGLKADVRATGGGIDCIFVQVGNGEELCFGTAAENWGASVDDAEGEYTGKDVWTMTSSNETDARFVADAIKDATEQYRANPNSNAWQTYGK
jgi:hypothetical protein